MGLLPAGVVFRIDSDLALGLGRSAGAAFVVGSGFHALQRHARAIIYPPWARGGSCRRSPKVVAPIGAEPPM